MSSLTGDMTGLLPSRGARSSSSRRSDASRRPSPSPPLSGTFGSEVLSHARVSVLAVVLVAFAVRIAALWAAADASLTLDEQTYALRAEALLDGEGFLGSYQSWVRHASGLLADLPQYPGAWQPPGQTVFMAALMAPSGRSLLAVKLAQVVLEPLGPVLLLSPDERVVRHGW